MKKLFQITSLDSAEAGQQILALRIGERHCCFAITDIPGEKLFQLAYYTTDEMDEGSLINLFANHPELNNSFHKVAVSYDHPQSVLVPIQYFNTEDTSLLIKTMHGANGQSAIASELLPEWQMYNVYAIPKEISEWVSKKFPLAEYHHNCTVGIRNIKEADDSGKLWVDFRADDFTLIAAKENKLLLAQTFAYSTPEDVIYYLLKATQQFSLSQKEVVLVLSGLIEKESSLYKELYNYFLNLEFRDAKWNVSGDNEYPAHFFTSLNNLSLCGL